jgi:hypothetical protein
MSETHVLFVVVVLLIAYAVVISVISYYERQDYLDRLMSKNLTEYRNEEPPKAIIKSAHRRNIEKWRRRGDDG